jgi:hypothetical protein
MLLRASSENEDDDEDVGKLDEDVSKLDEDVGEDVIPLLLSIISC